MLPYVRLLLQDPWAEVRKEVLLAVMRKKSLMLADAVRQLIHDPDSAVADKVLLQGKGILTRSEIAPFFKAENVDLRRTAIYSLGGAPDACVEELVALASHEGDQRCRIYAFKRFATSKTVLHFHLWRSYSSGNQMK
jgi:hypothetical protein